MDESKRSTISQAESDEQIGEFWDAHDFTDFDDPNAPDVEMTFTRAVLIDSELFIKNTDWQDGTDQK